MANNSVFRSATWVFVAFTAIGAQFLGVVFRLLRARGALQHKALTTKLAVDILVAFCYRFR